MPDDLLDHVSLSGSAARMSASASALPPPSEADEDIANLQDLAPDGSAAASGGFFIEGSFLLSGHNVGSEAAHSVAGRSAHTLLAVMLCRSFFQIASAHNSSVYTCVSAIATQKSCGNFSETDQCIS